MDDLCNLIPARISAILMMGAAGILGMSDRAHYSLQMPGGFTGGTDTITRVRTRLRPRLSVRER